MKYHKLSGLTEIYYLTVISLSFQGFVGNFWHSLTSRSVPSCSNGIILVCMSVTKFSLFLRILIVGLGACPIPV